MANKSIPDWKKAVIVASSCKYGRGSTGRMLGVSSRTVKRYRDKANDNGSLEMDGIDLEVKQ